MARRDEWVQFFGQPTSTLHREYEICRAYYFERQTAEVIAQRFGLHVGTVRSIVHDFDADPDKRKFFLERPRGRKPRPTTEKARQRIRQLRQEGLTLGQIVERLAEEGYGLSPAHVGRLLADEGFPSMRGRRAPSRPGERARDGSDVPAAADVSAVNTDSTGIIRRGRSSIPGPRCIMGLTN